MTRLVEKDSLPIVEEDYIEPPPVYHQHGPIRIITSDTTHREPRGMLALWVLWVCGGLVLRRS